VFVVEPELYGDKDEKYVSSKEADPDTLRRSAGQKAAPKLALLNQSKTLQSQTARLAISIVDVRLLLQQVSLHNSRTTEIDRLRTSLLISRSLLPLFFIVVNLLRFYSSVFLFHFC